MSSGEAIHVIENKTKKSTKKDLDEKSKKADQKRMESQNKMKNSYNEQKLAIKNALAGVVMFEPFSKYFFRESLINLRFFFRITLKEIIKLCSMTTRTML